MQKQIINLAIVVLSLNTFCYATANNQLFQNMDNQIAIGYGYSTATVYNPSYSGTQQTTTSSSANVSVEQLFDNNVWLNLNGNFIFSADQTKSTSWLLSNIQNFMIPASINGKIGYSFSFGSETTGLQIIPYITSGLALNYNGLSIDQNGFANSTYTLYGGGVRLEYVIIPQLSLFFDQTIGYLNDNGTSSKFNQSAMDYNSTLGIRYNVIKHLQLGLQGNFNQLYTTNSSLGYDNISFSYRNINQTSYGGLFSIAYLFNDTTDNSVYNYNNSTLAALDNSYSIGYGIAAATNSYSGGNSKNITSNLNFINLEVTHLFDNNVWARIDGNIITGITQANIPRGYVNMRTPTYLGFPGSVAANVGYAFAIPNINLQLIPYLNGAVVSNINSYNITDNTSLSYILSHDLFFQYGIGGRAEYAINKYWEIYYDQLFANMKDQSVMGLNAWRSTSTLGTKVNVYKNFQVGLNGFYDSISPTSQVYNPSKNINYAAQQNTYGALINIGMSY